MPATRRTLGRKTGSRPQPSITRSTPYGVERVTSHKVDAYRRSKAEHIEKLKDLAQELGLSAGSTGRPPFIESGPSRARSYTARSFPSHDDVKSKSSGARCQPNDAPDGSSGAGDHDEDGNTESFKAGQGGQQPGEVGLGRAIDDDESIPPTHNLVVEGSTESDVDGGGKDRSARKELDDKKGRAPKKSRSGEERDALEGRD